MAVAASRCAEGGRLTAAMASQISDGASAVLLASEQAVKDHGLTPRARIHHISARGADPVFMLTGADPGDRVCAGEDRPVDRRHRHRRDQRGVRAGGAGLAQGDRRRPGEGQPQRRRDRARPSARRDRRQAVRPRMLNELERTGGRYGLQTMCEGGGTANVTIIERRWPRRCPIPLGERRQLRRRGGGVIWARRLVVSRMPSVAPWDAGGVSDVTQAIVRGWGMPSPSPRPIMTATAPQTPTNGRAMSAAAAAPIEAMISVFRPKRATRRAQPEPARPPRRRPAAREGVRRRLR